MSIFGSILTMLIILSILVIVHELGHFIVARAFKVKVKEFAIFMGPKLYSKVSKKTGMIFSIRAIPIGGFCAMEGEEETVDSDTSYSSKPWYARALILLAGPFMNIILGLIATLVLFIIIGSFNTNAIGEVAPDSLAFQNSLVVGDKIIEYDGKAVLTDVDYNIFNEVDNDYISIIKIKHADGTKETITLDRTPLSDNPETVDVDESIQKQRIGFVFELKENANFFEIAEHSVKYQISLVRSIYYSIFWMFTGQLNLDSMSGPVGLTSEINNVVSSSELHLADKALTLFNFLAMISVNLGVVNLFFIPGLDGGHLFFILIELVRKGKKIPPEKEAVASLIGIGIVILLSVVIFGNDIIKLIK